MPVPIRLYTPEDCADCRAVFGKSVRDGATRYYTDEQRAVWAPEIPPNTPPPASFCARLDSQHTVVALDDAEIIGFMSLTTDGYLDLAFVLPGWMGRGVAQTLYDSTTQWARGHGLRYLSTHASHFARSFFARNGWLVETPETVTRDGQTFERFVMSIELSDQNDQQNQPNKTL